MAKRPITDVPVSVKTLEDLAKLSDYSLVDNLNCDPDATQTGDDYQPRQVFSGHYVPVKPTPIDDPLYVAHSEAFFAELGFDDSLAHTEAFTRLFSGDISAVPSPMRPVGWATGYALSIYGTEYIQQCPFQTGNGYGDGRAVSVLEAVINGKRWEMQLKGGGRTPYCRGGDGRAVLRSSVREFLAQEHMHALGVPTSRSLCLFVSQSEQVSRPWYSQGSYSTNPDMTVSNPVAISTRVAPSFLRVGQLELFARRARVNQYPDALKELEMIAVHLIEREYADEVNRELAITDQIVQLAVAFRERLTSLICHWLRVGYCQGNFNSDNCACGGYTLDYGPFGFVERFEPYYQPWTGGGQHFSFFNQGAAAQTNFNMFCKALQPLLASSPSAMASLNQVNLEFASVMQEKTNTMWASKLGLSSFDPELFNQLISLMVQTSVDYTIFFRELSTIPDDISSLSKSFYNAPSGALTAQWEKWLHSWRSLIDNAEDGLQKTAQIMLQVNPKYTWREWLVVPAYQQASVGNFNLVHELQQVLTQPYAQQPIEIEKKYYSLKPHVYFDAGGVSHYSCSS
ncbi:protein adenylyltransferase SelO family protein [Aliiglaciecola sp. 2_MG-2023]|uniref:protein adenylyltransferase SelO n=1 Tax=unclassified Aliiglaciecola TaxID=2593648 RepID=UPI0026E14807|nr:MULTISPECIES: protein adenylyltransferase SelO family protein [unclassified Aliiglaciecola]MDO6712755.1 protein adenylyltransferase SelO family protein [Aliiglaciecola sp. 2_MG-2023]MDO6753846.1 protein adenylyltransferase SelO family protein [Aliiglaciecola sp. 1_MG-2023]